MLHQYMPLARRISAKLVRSMPRTIELDDIISVATFGLIRAIEHYDETSQVHFETYAVAAIRSVVGDEMRRQDWAPRSLRKKQREIQDATTELERLLGREPSTVEVAVKLNRRPQEVEATLTSLHNISYRSLDEPIGTGEYDGDQNHSAYDVFAADDEDPQKLHGRQLILDVLTDVLHVLTVLDRAVLALYYFEGLTLQEASMVLGIPESRASQIHSRCMMTLRSKMQTHLAG